MIAFRTRFANEALRAHREAMHAASRDVFQRLLRQYGRNTVSHQLLGAGWRHYVTPSGDTGIAFRDCGSFALAAGDPLCAPGQTAAVIDSFRAWCRRSGRRVAFVSASEEVALTAGGLDLGALKVGEEGLFDLARYSLSGGAMKALRHHESRARRRGVSVRVLQSADPDWPAVVPALDHLPDTWLRNRSGGNLGFLLELRRPSEGTERDAVIFCAVLEGRAVAYLRAVPIYASAGVYLEDYVYGEDAPDGTVELVFHEACDALRSRGAAYVTWGTSPLAGLDRDDFSEAPLVGRVLRAVFEGVSWPYNFRSLHRFKARFHPTRWAFAACLLAADAGAAVPGSWSVFFPGQVIGLLSLVPGGFGGGDAYWILHLVGPAPAIVCAVLAYLFLYYLLPWALGSLAVLSSAAAPYRHGRSLPAVDLVR